MDEMERKNNSEPFDQGNDSVEPYAKDREDGTQIYDKNDSGDIIGTQENKEEPATEKACDEVKKENITFKEEDALVQDATDKGETDRAASKASDDVELPSAEYVWGAEKSRESSSWSNGAATYHFKPENMKEYVGRRNDASSSQYSYSYDVQQESPKKKKKKGKTLLIVALVTVVAILTLAIGGMAGYAMASKYEPAPNNMPSESEQIEEGDVELVKNDKPIDVRIKNGSTGYTDLTRSEVVELVADAVVEVTTSRVQTDSFFGGNYVTSGAGSGVVIAQNDVYAYIATNYHVIEGSTKIQITLTDKTVLEAEYLDGDSTNDIAMLRVKTDKEFPKIVCGSSKSLRVGDDVVAIGNPLGRLGGTVTEGIVSALDRSITVDGITMTLIQTSAAVNPGNSGGGLFNMAGELVGIVNAKQSAEGIEGLGFAIPIDSVYDMFVEIIESKYIHGRPTLGIECEYVSDVWTAYMKYGVRATGVFITSSTNDDLKSLDLLRSINGQLITDISSYAAAISELEIGETATVDLYRKGKLTTVSVEVKEYVPSGIFG